jgi:hypothetical protein
VGSAVGEGAICVHSFTGRSKSSDLNDHATVDAGPSRRARCLLVISRNARAAGET